MAWIDTSLPTGMANKREIFENYNNLDVFSNL